MSAALLALPAVMLVDLLRMWMSKDHRS